MTESTKVLDIAQRIAEAMQRSSEPRPCPGGQPNPNEDTVIGEVPLHLRHLHNLLEEISNEAVDPHGHFCITENLFNAFHTIFFASLRHHVPYNVNMYDNIRLCENWQVVGSKDMEARFVLGAISILRMIKETSH